ncbi:hypothetical protein ABK040_005459 [Willaertia magna]
MQRQSINLILFSTFFLIYFFSSLSVNAKLFDSINNKISLTTDFSSLINQIKEQSKLLKESSTTNNYLKEYLNNENNNQLFETFQSGTWIGDWQTFNDGCSSITLPFTSFRSNGAGDLLLSDVLQKNIFQFTKFVKNSIQDNIYFATVSFKDNEGKESSLPICTKVVISGNQVDFVFNVNVLNLCTGVVKGSPSCNIKSDSITMDMVTVFSYYGTVTMVIIFAIVGVFLGSICCVASCITCCICFGVCTCGGLCNSCVGCCSARRKAREEKEAYARMNEQL